MTEASRLLQLPQEECPEIGSRFPTRQRPKRCDNIEDTVVLLDKELIWSPIGLLWERTLENVLFEWRLGKYMGMSLRALKARIILIGLCAWYKMVWKKQNIGPMWENSAERKRPRRSNAIKISSVLRLHEKREQKLISKRFSPKPSCSKGYRRHGRLTNKNRTKEKYSLEKISAWSYDIMEGHAEACVEKYCELAKKDVSTLQQVAAPCINDQENTSRRLWNNQRALSLSPVCAQFFDMRAPGKNWTTRFQYHGPISNNLEHSLWQKVAKFDQIHQSDRKIHTILWCGKPDWRLQTWSVLRCFICRWRAGFKINVRRFTVRIQITHVCSISWMCKKQTAVSHSSAESEIRSLDAALRLDGQPAVQFWQCVLQTLSSRSAKGNLGRHKRERVIPSHSHSDNCVLESIGHVFANIHNSSHSTQLYTFEDNAAVIQMINKGRSPNLRHGTRTHRVALDWLFERMNLDHPIFDKVRANTWSIGGYFNTGNVTTIQWQSLFSLWQISRPHGSSDVRNVSRKPLSWSVWGKHQAISQVMTQAECVDQMRDKSPSKVLKPSCILDNHCSWSKWAIMSLHDHKTREIFLQEDSSPWMRRETSCRSTPLLRSCEKNRFVRQLVPSSVDCRTCTRQKFTSSQILFYVWETGDEHTRRKV